MTDFGGSSKDNDINIVWFNSIHVDNPVCYSQRALKVNTRIKRLRTNKNNFKLLCHKIS